MISFEAFIRSNYTAACRELRGFVHDEGMKEMLARGEQDIGLVKSWMGDYDLLRGISSEKSDKIVKRCW